MLYLERSMKSFETHYHYKGPKGLKGDSMKKLPSNHYFYGVYILYFIVLALFRANEEVISNAPMESLLGNFYFAYDHAIDFVLVVGMAFGAIEYYRRQLIAGRQLLVLPIVVIWRLFQLNIIGQRCDSNVCYNNASYAWLYGGFVWASILVLVVAVSIWLTRKNRKKLLVISGWAIADSILLLLAINFLI